MLLGVWPVRWWSTAIRCTAALATVGFAVWGLHRTMSNQRSEPATRDEIERLPPDPSAEDLGYPPNPDVGWYIAEDGQLVVYEENGFDTWASSHDYVAFGPNADGGETHR